MTLSATYVAIKSLYIEVDCDDCFGWTVDALIHGMPNLEFLEIRDLMGYPDWRREWNPTMDSWYCTSTMVQGYLFARRSSAQTPGTRFLGLPRTSFARNAR